MLAAAQPVEADCGRYRGGDDLQPCEFQRDERADVLNAAGRPSAASLGADVIRFSTRPELGGRAIVVEVVSNAAGGAKVRLFTLRGHPRDSWEAGGQRSFDLAPDAYRQLAAAVDAAIADRIASSTDARVMVVCSDGPGYLTERVRDGTVVSLVGFCPPRVGKTHPNTMIARLIQDVVCRYQPEAQPVYWFRRDCPA